MVNFKLQSYNIMSQFISTLLIIFAFFIIAIVLLNISYLIKGREFRGSCASNNPLLKDKFGACTVCGKTAEEDCKMPEVKK